MDKEQFDSLEIKLEKAREARFEEWKKFVNHLAQTKQMSFVFVDAHQYRDNNLQEFPAYVKERVLTVLWHSK